MCVKFAEVTNGIWQTGKQNLENLPQKTVESVVPKVTTCFTSVTACIL